MRWSIQNFNIHLPPWATPGHIWTFEDWIVQIPTPYAFNRHVFELNSLDLRGLQTCRALARNKEWNQRINASSIWITKGYKLLSCVTITTKTSVAHCDTQCFGNPPNAKTAWFENAIFKKKFFFLSLYQSLYLLFFLLFWLIFVSHSTV